MYKLTLFLALFFALSGGFVTGYSVANYPISGTTNIDVATIVDNNQPLLQKQEEPPAYSAKAKKGSSTVPLLKVTGTNDEATGVVESESFQQLLVRLLNIKSQASGMRAQGLYASMKQVALQQPDLVIEHMDILLTEPVNSRKFQLLSSLLGNIPQSERQNALLNVIQQMDVYGDDGEQEKLISLLQYVEPQAIPAYIVDSLVSLASSSPSTDNNLKLEALSLLNPPLLDDGARQAIVQSLIGGMQNASDSEIESLFAQSLRFADQYQKQQMAKLYLQSYQSEDLQHMVLESIINGGIVPDFQTISLLQQIADDTSHPCWQEAHMFIHL